mmetsp:Transcript_10998/g.31303  ORF Transcript_10998/g.31303 Transcript_10998/m.31303 type:complete len:253 (-) Transcript_10998:530-1288(-)
MDVVPDVSATALAAGALARPEAFELLEGDDSSVLVAPRAILRAGRHALAAPFAGQGIPHAVRGRGLEVRERIHGAEAIATDHEAVPRVEGRAITGSGAAALREATAVAIAVVVGVPRAEGHTRGLFELVRCPHFDLDAVDLGDVEAPRTPGARAIVADDLVRQVEEDAVEVRGVDLPQAHGVEHSGPSGAVHVELQNRLVRRYLREGGLLDVDGVVRPLLPALHPLALVEEDLLAEPTIGVAHAVAMDEAGA